jgi:hypothetical protein
VRDPFFTTLLLCGSLQAQRLRPLGCAGGRDERAD